MGFALAGSNPVPGIEFEFKMKWLKKILGIKDREEASIGEVELRAEELDSWLDERASGLLSELNEKISSLYPKIKEVIKDVGEKVAILSKVDLSEKKVTERVKNIVVDNRDSYVRQVNSFVKNFTVPEKFGYVEAIAFHSLFTSKLDRLARNSFRNLSLTSELIGEESVAVNEGLKRLDGLVKEIKSAISDEKIHSFYKVKEAIKELKNLQAAKSKFGSVKEGLLLREKEMENEAFVFRERITKLKESREYKELRGLIDRREGVSQQINNIDFKIRNLFGPLQKALQKFLQMNKDSPEAKVLKKYVEDTVTALINDEEFKIINLLEDTKEALIEGRIDLKDKKKEQTLKIIRDVNVDVLKSFVERRKALERDEKEIGEKISAVDVMGKIEDAQKGLYGLKSSRENLNKEVMKLGVRQERISFEELEKKIIAGIELVTNARVKLSHS